MKGISNGMLDYDLIMVDEMSMTDAFLFAALLKAAKDGAKLCLIGDADQLPSVGAGDVLAQIIGARSERIGVVKLNKVYRQKDGSLPALNAFLIKNGKDSLDYGETFQFVQANTFEQAAEEMWDIYRREVAIEGIDNVMMVTPNNKKTASGVKALNEIRDEINPAKEGKAEYQIGKRIFREGDKVVQLKNVMKNGVSISNGDIGYISTIEKGGNKTCITVSFSMNRVAEYEPFELEELDLAYATTIHKSQGNQARVVILDILDSHSIMLRRNLLYTAITRAEERVYVVGQKSAISKAISIGVRDEDKRITNLATMIRQTV
jgi:exodeoxyribonuclease V alpha subunit